MNLSQSLNIEVNPEHQYSSCERGLSEYINRLLRRYFPNKMNFSKVDAYEHVADVAELNASPRKVQDLKRHKACSPYVFWRIYAP